MSPQTHRAAPASTRFRSRRLIATIAWLALALAPIAAYAVETIPFTLTPNGEILTAVYSTSATARLVARDLIGFVSYVKSRLATQAAATKNAADVAATPYAAAVTMVLDRLEDKRRLLRIALKHERILVAKEILVDIYDTEYALRVRIDQFAESAWGQRLDALIASITEFVESEIKRFPGNVGHVLESRRLRSHHSLAGQLSYRAWNGRDGVNGAASLFKKALGSPEKSRA